MRYRRPRSPSILDDPDIETWADGSIWHHRKEAGGTKSYTRLKGPDTAEREPRERPSATSEVDWNAILFGVLVLLAFVGFVSLISMFSGREIGCSTLAGCYVVLPHR